MTKKRQGRRSAEDAQKTKERILKIATDLFSEFGYAQVSLRSISERAGISHSLIRHHFGSKEQIWYHISDETRKHMESYCQLILNSLPEYLPVNEKLYQFSIRVLAFTLINQKPIKLSSDVIDQEGERFDYFFAHSSELAKIIDNLVSEYNASTTHSHIEVKEINWEIILYAHAAASLEPFLKANWPGSSDTSKIHLLKHWELFNNLMANKLQVKQSQRLFPKGLNELIYSV
ncbi:TetR/AcrR family transcriptional regulator [Vibrio salinus]|uniref:TetR/AcrR family transcriptional regulator n=1 Tax=Vibrio salinus TaxID=2899784 RepID=UPI001E5F8B64|nr:TetR/AcrR family transcriptional regulator [Vibrio salinus]MCE0496042.1 TetR/AcrR family transcriptional regulator [Vibrio salinus]